MTFRIQIGARKAARLWAVLVLLIGAFALHHGQAQQTVIGKVKNFSISPEFHKPPHQAQMKSFLQGAEAVPSAGGRVITIKDGKLQTFQESGRREMVVIAPHCVYESTQRTISSEGTLKAETADGRFAIEGVGFLWHATNSSLVISNQVRTFIHPDLVYASNPDSQEGAASAVSPGEGLQITSDRFEFLSDLGLGIYLGNVRVAGTNLNMTAGKLTIQMPVTRQALTPLPGATNLALRGSVPSPGLPGASRHLESIIAESKVEMDYSGVHATGEQVVYSTGTELIEVTGQPTWQADDRQGRADAVTIDRTNRIFVARGNAWLKLPGQTLGPATLLPSDRPSALQPRSGASFLEIRSATYELRTNHGVFDKEVRVVERRGEAVAGAMTCNRMTVQFSGTNQLERLEATENVVIEQEDKRLTGARAVYTSTNSILELQGSPAWVYGDRKGKGDTITIDSKTEEMFVKGNASLRMPAQEFGALNTPVPGGQKSLVPVVAPAGTNAVEFADLFSEEYVFAPRGARFRGGVYISHPRMNWACEELTFDFPVQTNNEPRQVERIVANQGVTFDLLDRNGQKVNGRGDRAVYTYNVKGNVTNDFVQLTGNPVLERRDKVTDKPITIRNQILILDRVSNQVIAPGDYSISGYGKVGDTNVMSTGQPAIFPK